MPGALTLRQAKAAHKARGSTAVSEKEIRQIHRELQLERRAWTIKEREKGRTKAIQARTAEQRRLKADEAAAQLATQRRCDRFGHKSSQFHLGAFFQKAPAAMEPVNVVKEREDFTSTSDDLDDETLLAALHGVDAQVIQKANELVANDQETKVAAGDLASEQGTTSSCSSGMTEHIDWDDFLESATQISRELGNGQEIPRQQTLQLHNMSFESCSSFGLTTQDLEDLDPTTTQKLAHGTNAGGDRRLMLPHTKLSTKQPQVTNAIPGRNASRNHSTATQAEFSLTQLEHFVDQDMSLSQI